MAAWPQPRGPGRRFHPQAILTDGQLFPTFSMSGHHLQSVHIPNSTPYMKHSLSCVEVQLKDNWKSTSGRSKLYILGILFLVGLQKLHGFFLAFLQSDVITKKAFPKPSCSQALSCRS